MRQNGLLEVDRASRGTNSRGGAWPHLLWYAGVVGAALGAVVSLARLMDMMWTGHYHKVLIPIIMAFAALIFFAPGSRLRIDSLGFCLLAIIPFGTIVGFLHEGEPRYFLAHFGAAVFGFLLYAASRNTEWNEKWLEGFWRKSSYLILLAFIISIGAFWIIRFATGSDLYLGIGTGDLVFPLAYFLVYKKYRNVALTLILFLLSGKRGSLLAAMAVILFHIPLPGRTRLALRSAFVTMTALLIVLASFDAEPLVRAIDLPSVVREILDKWYMANFLNDNFNIDYAFSGRNQELVLSFRVFVEHAHHWLVGMGYGWSYFFDAVIKGSETTDFRVHYVHMSPANLLLLYGVPLASLLLILMWYNVSRAYHYSMLVVHRPIIRVLVLFWLGSFVSSLSGYSYPTDPMFWLSLGTLSSFMRRGVAPEMTPCAV